MNVKEVKNEEKELELDIWGMCVAVLKKLWIVILAAVIAGALAVCYYRITYTPQYKTDVDIYIYGKDEYPVTTSALQIATNVAKDYEVQVNSPLVLDKVIASIKEKGIKTDFQTLSKNVSAQSLPNTREVRITVTWDDPDDAAVIANTVRDVAMVEIEGITKVPSKTYWDAKPGAEIANSIFRNTVIIAFLGACVAAVMIAFLYIIDNKITSKGDIEGALGLPVFAVIPRIEKKKLNKRAPRQEKQAVPLNV